MVAKTITLLATGIVAISIMAAAIILSSPVTTASGASTPASEGVQLKIIGASIPDDLKPVVTFTLADGNGSPLRLADIDQNGLRFTIAAIQTDSETNNTRYVSYVVNTANGTTYQFEGETRKAALASATQAAMDSGGVFADLGGGKFSYTFKTAAPKDFDTSATHAVGGYATRGNRASVSNDVFYFVPAGGEVKVERQVVTTENCNACHDNLAAHGGTRRDTRLCVLCHTSQSTDVNSGNTVDFKVLVHKIHSGANLPSVKAGTPFFIGSDRHDFSDVGFPQDTRNCQTCHKDAPQGDNFKTKPSAQACGSCHDNVNFQTGENHPGGPQPTNANCAACHTADGPEFGTSVAGAHTIPTKSTQLRGVNFQIVSFANTKPGQSPTAVFNIKDDAGQPIAPSEMARLALTLSGPTTDYANVVQETANTATATDDGNYSYTFKARIADNAQGTYAVGIEGYLQEQLKTAFGGTLNGPDGKPLAVRDAGFNQIAYGAVTDEQPMPRKKIVDVSNCNSCHETLAEHGGSRLNTDYCVLCHNPMNSDLAKRAAAGGPMPAEPLTFNRLIHRIHTGEDQNDKFAIYSGGAGSEHANDLSEARYPTDRRNCAKCHIQNSNLLSFFRSGALPSTVKQGDTVLLSIPPIQAACTGCHDSAPAKAHTETMTAAGGREACLTCHNEGRDYSVSKVHAR